MFAERLFHRGGVTGLHGFENIPMPIHEFLRSEQDVPMVIEQKFGDVRTGGTGPVSYTHLDVYKRQPLLFVAPQVFLTERFLPGWAPLHILLAGFWASWVASRLGDRDAAPRTRLFIWRLFSVVFFVQLALGLAGYGLFLMTGNLHLPVPGMILAAPLYRGGGLFMPILFGVSVLLAGAAWCSHLCLSLIHI